MTKDRQLQSQTTQNLKQQINKIFTFYTAIQLSQTTDKQKFSFAEWFSDSPAQTHTHTHTHTFAYFPNQPTTQNFSKFFNPFC
jgi:hypothetical protein